MSAWARAVLRITRKKAPSLLLCLLMLAMFFGVAVMWPIQQSAQRAVVDLRQSMITCFTVETEQVQDDLFWETREMPNGIIRTYTGPKVDEAMRKQIMDTVNAITSYNAEFSSTAYCPDLQLMGGLYEYSMGLPDRISDAGDTVMRHSIGLLGNTDSSLNKHFRNGAFELIEGRHIGVDDQGKSLISEWFAQANQLSVGDVFYSYNSSWYEDGMRTNEIVSAPIPHEVVGIFRIITAVEPSEWTPESYVFENMVFCDMHSSAMEQFHYTGLQQVESYQYLTFFVDDPALLDQAISDAKNIDSINWDYYKISLEDDAYTKASFSLRLLNGIAIGLMMVVLVTCLILLYLVLSMQMKTRVREMGIYISLGESKRNILFQYLSEVLMLMLPAMLISLTLASLFVPRLGEAGMEMVLSAQRQNTLTAEAYHSVVPEKVDGQYELGLDIEAPIPTADSLKATLDKEQIPWIVAGGFCATTLMLILATSPLLRKNPRELFSILT